MMYNCIENTIDIIISNSHIRLWIGKEEVSNDYHVEKEIAEYVRKHLAKTQLNRVELVEYLSHIPNINAVQVKDMPNENQESFGTMVYTVEF